MAEQVDAPDLISRVNCFNKSDSRLILNFDWIVTNNLDNPVVRRDRAGSIPAPSTMIMCCFGNNDSFFHSFVFSFLVRT